MESALTVDLLDKMVHTSLGFLLQLRFGEYQKAKGHYEKALNIDPSFADASYFMGNLYLNHLSDKKTARMYFERALQGDPNMAIAYMGICYTHVTELGYLTGFRKAKEYYIRATTLDKSLIEEDADRQFGIRRH